MQVANQYLTRNLGVIDSFSRRLLEWPTTQQSIEDFDSTLNDSSVEQLRVDFILEDQAYHPGV
jgi:hypothetical protein